MRLPTCIGLISLSCPVLLSSGCSDLSGFDPDSIASGPGSLVGGDSPINTGVFSGGDDVIPARREVVPPQDDELPVCDAVCEEYCAQTNLENPVNKGLCTSTWGVGLDSQPINRIEACRRLYMDLVGYYPTNGEIGRDCWERSWTDVVMELLQSEEFVLQCRRRWADVFRYNNVSVSVARLFDMDHLVEKFCGGYVAYDEFAAVASAHPVLMRVYGTPADRAEAIFSIFLGRSPFENERSDFARLYAQWANDYYDHKSLGMRLPDSWIAYRCVGDDGQVDDERAGGCTSVLYGYNQLVLEPDVRAQGEIDGVRAMWSGLLTAAEWRELQKPGRVLAAQSLFWEHIIDRVLMQYLDYDLVRDVPEVRAELLRYFVGYRGDIRALHFAVVTSAAYLQSAHGTTATNHRWTFGPLKQVQAEGWVGALERSFGLGLGQCDHRLPSPEQLLDEGAVGGRLLVGHTQWSLDADGRIQSEYRDLVRTLGGCPDYDPGQRFRIISVLTTGVQLGFAESVCDPALSGGTDSALASALMPSDVDADTVLTEDLAERILQHQATSFLSRYAYDDEIAQAREAGRSCAEQACTAEAFARPLCYALLSSSEQIFY